MPSTVPLVTAGYLGLHADDEHVRLHGLHGERHPGDQAAAAHGDHDGVHIRHLAAGLVGKVSFKTPLTWSRISRPMVPWPARMLGWSYPLTYMKPRLAAILRACVLLSPMFSPWMMTLAPYFLQFSTCTPAQHCGSGYTAEVTFMMGATMGITTVTGMSSWPPW